jgi:hypothetical protein
VPYRLISRLGDRFGEIDEALTASFAERRAKMDAVGNDIAMLFAGPHHMTTEALRALSAKLSELSVMQEARERSGLAKWGAGLLVPGIIFSFTATWFGVK